MCTTTVPYLAGARYNFLCCFQNIVIHRINGKLELVYMTLATLSFRQLTQRICWAGDGLQYFSRLLCRISSEQFVEYFSGLLPWSGAIRTGAGANVHTMKRSWWFVDSAKLSLKRAFEEWDWTGWLPNVFQNCTVNHVPAIPASGRIKPSEKGKEMSLQDSLCYSLSMWFL